MITDQPAPARNFSSGPSRPNHLAHTLLCKLNRGGRQAGRQQRGQAGDVQRAKAGRVQKWNLANARG